MECARGLRKRRNVDGIQVGKDGEDDLRGCVEEEIGCGWGMRSSKHGAAEADAVARQFAVYRRGDTCR